MENELESLRERISDWESQQKRLVANYVSEKEFRKEQGKLLDDARRRIESQEYEIRRLSKEIDEQDKMLREAEKGLMFRVPKLEYWRESRKENLTFWFGIIALIISLLSLYMQYRT